MSKKIFFFCLLLVSINQAFATPRLVLEEKEYNFGEIAEGNLVEHKFKIYNQGTSTLEIRKINASCGCTAAVVDTDKIAPGQSTFIKTSFNSTGFRGSIDKSVSVYSNDPENVSVTLFIKGKITSDVIISPTRVFLGDVAKGSIATAEVRLSAEEGKKIKFGEVKSRSELLSVNSSSLPGGGKLLKISLSKEAPLGDFQGRVSVSTTSKFNPVINIPVIAHIHGDLLFTPKSLSLGVFEGPLEEAVTGSVLVNNTAEKPINIKAVNSSSSAVSVDFSVIKAGAKYSINVELPRGSIGVIQSVLTVKTDHPDSKQQEVSIPVYAIINPSQDK